MQRSAQTYATCANRGDLGRQACKGDVDFDPTRGQIGPSRVSEHDIFDPLGAQADIDQIIAGLNPAPVEFAADEIFRDRRALGPYSRQHQRERTRADAEPSQPAPAYRRFAVIFFHAYRQPRLSCDADNP